VGFVYDLAKIRSINPLHHNESYFIIPFKLKQTNNIWMFKFPQNFGLIGKSIKEKSITAQIPTQDLNSHFCISELIPGKIHIRHSSRTNQFTEKIPILQCAT